MVLLESIFSDEEGRYGGVTIDGEEVRINSVPIPNSVAIYGKKNLKRELERLRSIAKADNTHYYLIENSRKIRYCSRYNPQSFSIAYCIFDK